MSEFVRVKGQLKKTELNESDAKEILERRGFEKPTYHTSWLEFCLEKFYDEFVKIGEDFYKVKSIEEISPTDTYCEVDENLNFDAQYYSGRFHWSELVGLKLNEKIK